MVHGIGPTTILHSPYTKMAWLAGCWRNRFERSERDLWPSFSRHVSKDALRVLRGAPRDLIDVSLGREEKGSGVLCNPETR